MSAERQNAATCPDLEMLAALIDGRLEDPERSEVMEHLADCERCYEVFTESARTVAEDEKAGAGEVVPMESGRPAVRRRPVWAALAAAALIAVVLVPVYLDSGALGVGQLAQPALLAGGDDPLSTIYTGDDWSRTRGFGTNLRKKQRAFRLGVRAVDLEVALRAADSQAARRLLGEQAAVVAGIELSEPLVISYEMMKERLKAGEAPGDLTELSGSTDELVEEAADFETGGIPIYALGKWAEAGRMAAIAGDRRFFQRRAIRAFVGEMLETDLPAELLDPLRNTRRLMDSRLERNDLAMLAEELTEIVAAGGDL